MVAPPISALVRTLPHFLLPILVILFIFKIFFANSSNLVAILRNLVFTTHAAIFRSLLYEACGRIVNPIYGSVGLMWSGSWHLCHGAVEAVLRGAPVTQMATEAAEAKNGPPLKAYDIRHVNKDNKFSGSSDLRRVRNRCRFKRTGKRARASAGSADESGRDEVNGSLSHEFSLSHQSETAATKAAEPSLDCESQGGVSLASADDAEPDHEAELALDDSVREEDRLAEEGELQLELTLGFEPFSRCVMTTDSAAKRARGSASGESGFCKMELRLDCPTS